MSSVKLIEESRSLFFKAFSVQCGELVVVFDERVIRLNNEKNAIRRESTEDRVIT